MNENKSQSDDMKKISEEIGIDAVEALLKAIKDYRAGTTAGTPPPGQGRARLKRLERVTTARGECLRLTWETVVGQKIQQLVDLGNSTKLGRIWSALGLLERPEQNPVGRCAWVTVGRRRGQNGTTWPDMVHVTDASAACGHTWDSVTVDRWRELGRDEHGFRTPRPSEPVSGVTCPPPARTEPPLTCTTPPPETLDSGHWPDETSSTDEPEDVREYWSRDVYGHYTYRNDPANKRL